MNCPEPATLSVVCLGCGVELDSVEGFGGQPVAGGFCCECMERSESE